MQQAPERRKVAKNLDKKFIFEMVPKSSRIRKIKRLSLT